MRTLHWSSTSFGYMKPSTGICKSSSFPKTHTRFAKLLAHRAVHAVVKNFCSRCHVRFQYLHRVRAQEFMNRVIRILQVRELPRAGGTDFAASRSQSLGDAVITE